jgi:ABC-type molybdenum transport system ATPase subunit/photorepair protein PhrA
MTTPRLFIFDEAIEVLVPSARNEIRDGLSYLRKSWSSTKNALTHIADRIPTSSVAVWCGAGA